MLTDFLRGELSASDNKEVQDRLDRDEPFKRLHDDISNTFAAMKLLPEDAPPEDLVNTTLARIDQARRTEALLAREEGRRAVTFPTFSLRELSAVAAAVILMAAILVPSMRQARYRAQIGKCASNVGQIGAAILSYANANDDYLPAADGLQNRWLPTEGQAAFSNSAALYKLVRFGYTSPVVFRCPTGGAESFHTKAGMSDFPSEKYITYSYQHTRGPRPMRQNDPILAEVAERMVILADSTPLFARGFFRRESINHPISENHRRTGQNVLYLDMRVSWADSPTVGVRGDNIYLVKGVLEYRGDEKPSEPTDTFLLPTFSRSR